MKNKRQLLLGKKILLYLLLLIAVGLVGCVGLGRFVPADERVLFDAEGSDQGSFSRNSLTVAYSYRLTEGTMTVGGDIDYTWPVDSLQVYLLFLDAAGTVLQKNIVYYSGYRVAGRWTTERNFQETMAVPPGTVGISFDYSAQPRSSHK